MKIQNLIIAGLTTLLLGLPALSQENGKVFKTPEDAVASMASAIEARDNVRLEAILGSDILNYFESDPALRNETYRMLSLLFKERWALAPMEDGSRIVRLGLEGWPFPVPLVKAKGGGWMYDLDDGVEELLNRRIGRNELLTIETFERVLEAQNEYVKGDPDGDGVKVYASSFSSAPGKKNGLYWEVKPGEPPSPLEKSLKDAFRYTQGRVKGSPWFGYHYVYLDHQGPAAKGGAFAYSVDGKQTRGWGMVAYPASYGSTGVKTFMTNQDGKVFEKDLGEDTIRTVFSMDGFNPSEGWEEVPAQPTP
jgi:hypothetical protein